MVSYTLTLAGDVVYSGEKNVSGLAPNETISFESVQPVALYGIYFRVCATIILIKLYRRVWW